MLQRVVHGHDVETGGRKRRVLNEPRRDGHAKHLAGVARGTVDPVRGQTHRSRASAARTQPLRRRRPRRECERRSLYRVRATDSDSARPARTGQRVASMASIAPCSRAGIRSSNSGARPLRLAAGSTRRARTCGRPSSAADARLDRECRAPRHRSSRRDCRGLDTQSRLETSTNRGSSDPSRKFLGFRSNICWRART